ncbi:hypothetical protein BD770DRAFT_914 [Pilaira anomala]|nr:hypothetical protein BD770DRAFT_914 [Pilaira anomala]
MRSLDRNLKSYIGNLKKRDYTKAELRGFLPQKNDEGTNSNITINTIFSANDNSKVVINQADSRKRNRKERDEDGGDPTTNVSCEIDTNYTAKFMIINVDILSPWNQYKIHCQNHLWRGSSTVETDTAKLL